MTEVRQVNLDKPENKDMSDMFIDVRMPNAITAGRFNNDFGGDKYTTEGAILQQHIKVSKKVDKGNLADLTDMLTSQALLLNYIFAKAANRAADNINDHAKVSGIYMNMALKAQSQCRCTIEALNEMKNPKAITITKQANIAGQQVVNNGSVNIDNTTKTDSRAEKNQNRSNELLGEVTHERVDSRKKTTTKRSHTKVEAVAKVNRSNHTRGQS